MSNDAEIFDHVTTYVKDFSTAVDVGAHKGVWAEKMALAFEKVHCFEPNILLYNRLAVWCDCSVDNVTVHNVALLDFKGSGSLCYDGDREHKIRAHYILRNDYGDVKINKLDSYKISNCGLLKVDVEGGELPVLCGARRILRHQKPVVVVEHKTHHSVRFKWSLSALLIYMRDLGYHVAFRKEPNLVFVI